MIKFIKMQGCGNDYIYIDCMNGEPADPNTLSIKMSDRRFGVGGDGLVLICRSEVAAAKMRIFNADGSEAKMCGNAIRCVARYLAEHGMTVSDSFGIETLSGIKSVCVSKAGGDDCTVRVDMGAPILSPRAVPSTCCGDSFIRHELTVEGVRYIASLVSMGNPHCILFDRDNPLTDNGVFDGGDISVAGCNIGGSDIFPEGVNVEFARVSGESTVDMRVWERGSGETFACGTGACAVTVAAIKGGLIKPDITVTVHLRGGDLQIEYTGETVYMTGPATTVFTGVWHDPD